MHQALRCAALAALVACAPLGCAPGGNPAAGPGVPAPLRLGSAPARPWDQAAVAKLAADLAQACIHLYDEFYDEQGIDPKIGSGDEGQRFRLKFKLQRIEEQTLSLAAALKAGKGRAETTPSVEDVGELADDVRVILSQMFVEHPLQQRIEAARAIWVQLLPYYGIAPPSGAPVPPA
jgi:hypothetical protein